MALGERTLSAERAIAELALRCRSRADYRRELAAVLGRTLHFDRLIIGAERDRSAPLTGHAGGRAGAPEHDADDPPRAQGHVPPPITWHWRSAAGTHWLQVVCEGGIDADELAAWLQLLPTIKLAEAHWLAVEGLRGARARQPVAHDREELASTSAAETARTPPRAFLEAVRDALRHLHELSLLADSPLLDSCVVSARVRAAGSEMAPVYALQEQLLALIGELAEHTPTVFWHRALHHTYVVPADTQARAAELSHTSYGSYRRFVARGVSEVAMRLWLLERAQRAMSEPDCTRPP